MTPAQFTKRFEIRWADLDPNRHLRHTAYNDYATHVRFSYLAEKGFSTSRFIELQIGPVVFFEQTRYFKEVGMNEVIIIDFKLAGFAEDGSRWRLRHEVFRADGVTAAVVSLEGAWMDIVKRKLTVPPADLTAIFKDLPRTSDYENIVLK